MDDASCRGCGGPTEPAFVAQERWTGIEGRFEYLRCRACGALQIARIPAGLERFADAMGQLAKTDPIDACMIALFAQRNAAHQGVAIYANLFCQIGKGVDSGRFPITCPQRLIGKHGVMHLFVGFLLTGAAYGRCCHNRFGVQIVQG